MRTTGRSWKCVVAALALVGCAPRAPVGADATTDGALESGADAASGSLLVMRRTKIGSPNWEIGGGQQFVALLGSRINNFSTGLTTVSRVLFGGHEFNRISGLFVPGAAHNGPYELELPARVRAQGFASVDRLTVAQFSAPSGLFLLLSIWPGDGAPSGRTADAERGPMIANALFPLSVEETTYRGSEPWDQIAPSMIPATSELSPPRAEEGWSHLVLAFALSLEAANQRVAQPGSYEWRLRVLDRSRSGWEVSIPFELVP